MKKNPLITLPGTILREIKEEGKAKGYDWTVRPLFITRNEQTEENIGRELIKLQKKVDRQRQRNPAKEVSNPTRADAMAFLPFPTYRNTRRRWRRYTREEADDLKRKIKQILKFI